MSTLDSTSTLAEIKAAYADNASYAEDDSAAKAAGFITACRLLLLRLYSAQAQGEEKIERDPAVLQEELKTATQWWQQSELASTGQGIIHASFQNFRD